MDHLSIEAAIFSYVLSPLSQRRENTAEFLPNFCFSTYLLAAILAQISNN